LNRNGVALIVTLWVLVLLSVLAMSFSFATRRETASTRNLKEDMQAHYLAVSMYEEALAYILTDTDLQVDFIDAEGNFYTDEDREPITGVKEVDGAEVSLMIRDEESRLNINTASPAVLRKLFEYAGVPDSLIQGLVDSLLDWKDADDLHRLEGAEEEYYEPFGYPVKNRALDAPEELLLIKGFDEYYYESESILPLAEFVSTWSQGINVNTASRELLEALEVSAFALDSIAFVRDSQKPLRQVPAPLAGAGGTTKSVHFRIEVVARVPDNPRGVKITSVVRRVFSREGPELKTMYWKEEIENTRA
jgi:general secretion pathway protein K